MFFLTGIHAFANKQISADKITEQLLYIIRNNKYTNVIKGFWRPHQI